MASGEQFHWTSASHSHVGLVREINEDACLDWPEAGVWVVADGMGGHSLGDVASRHVIEAIGQVPPAMDLKEFSGAAREKLLEVNQQLREEAAIRGVQVIGTTVVLLCAKANLCSCLWAGDSRIYLYRQGKLVQLTRDHSQVEELLSRGALSPEEAADYPLRNLVTRAVGAAETLEIDEETLEVQDGDMFLLCSDGLSNEVSSDEISAALISGNCTQAAEILIELALSHGGRDNISVIVVRAEETLSPDKTVLNPIFL